MKEFPLALILSLGIHGLILLVLPSPLTFSHDSNVEIVSLIPIVELPDLNQGIATETAPIIPPVQEPLSIPPLDLSARIPPPPDDFPLDLSFDKVIEPVPPKQSYKPPVALPPPNNAPPSIPEKSEDSKQVQTPPQVALNPELYTQEFANIYNELTAKCGIENVVRLTIPHPEEELVSQISESIAGDVPWIPPVYLPAEILQGLDITIPVTLVVESDGTISRRRFISSNLDIIDGIILQTIDRYEGKFAPLPGKCRLVTTKYKFSGN